MANRATIKKTYLSGSLIYPLTIANAVYDVTDEDNPVPISLVLNDIKETINNLDVSGTTQVIPITDDEIDALYNDIAR